MKAKRREKLTEREILAIRKAHDALSKACSVENTPMPKGAENALDRMTDCITELLKYC